MFLITSTTNRRRIFSFLNFLEKVQVLWMESTCYEENGGGGLTSLSPPVPHTLTNVTSFFANVCIIRGLWVYCFWPSEQRGLDCVMFLLLGNIYSSPTKIFETRMRKHQYISSYIFVSILASNFNRYAF